MPMKVAGTTLAWGEDTQTARRSGYTEEPIKYLRIKSFKLNNQDQINHPPILIGHWDQRSARGIDQLQACRGLFHLTTYAPDS